MRITLGITTFNRSHLLDKSLERLTHLTIPDEVLVVDDGSIDATKEVCEGFKNRLPIKYIYNHSPSHTICSFARNIIVKNMTGEVLITSEPELLFVTDIVKQMKDKCDMYPNHVISVGTIYHMQEHARLRDLVYTDPKQFLSESVVEEYIIEPRPYNIEGFVKTVNLTASYSALYRKDWLMEVGGWDEQFPGNYGFDDTDLLTRLRISGYNQIISNEMEAIHQFHPHQLPHVMGANAKLNDEYFTNKNMQDANNPFIVANKGKPWGIVKER